MEKKRKGNPNNQDFSNRVSLLYSLAYGVKMGYKSLAKTSNIEVLDFVVYPLEGIWCKITDTTLIKENLEYIIVIRQPDFITKEKTISIREFEKEEAIIITR